MEGATAAWAGATRTPRQSHRSAWVLRDCCIRLVVIPETHMASKHCHIDWKHPAVIRPALQLTEHIYVFRRM